MEQDTVRLLIPFESLVDSIRALSWQEKRRLWTLLEEEMAQAEEETWEQDPVVQAEIRDARAAYESGDYITIDEYIAQQKKKAE